MPQNIAQQYSETSSPVIAVCRHIAAQPDVTHSLESLAQRVNLSTHQLHRQFKAQLQITPKAFADALRMHALKNQIHDAQSVTDALYAAGFSSSSRLYERATAQLGMTPKQYRQRGDGLEISYATAKTELGLAMIGATDKGICFLQFGDSKDALLQLLRSEFAKAQISTMQMQSQSQFNAWIDALNAQLRGEKTANNLPLDIRGTAFQLRVWEYLQKIPKGQVVSYAQLAQAIEQPKASRAAASACAKNRIAVLIPCHRVIRGDGGLGGYRWGLERKRALLKSEGVKTALA